MDILQKPVAASTAKGILDYMAIGFWTRIIVGAVIAMATLYMMWE